MYGMIVKFIYDWIVSLVTSKERYILLLIKAFILRDWQVYDWLTHKNYLLIAFIYKIISNKMCSEIKYIAY